MHDTPMLLVELTSAGPDALTVSARAGWGSDLGATRWRGAHPVEMEAIAREVAGLDAARRVAVMRPGRAADKVRAHGQLLFDLLLPAPVKAAIREAETGALMIDADLGGLDVPWAMLHDGQDHLGHRLALGEGAPADAWPDRPAPHDAPRTLVMADPAADLPAARIEGEALASVFGQAARPPAYDLRLGRTTRSDALRALRRYAVMHFAGHVDPPADDGAHGGGLRLADGRLEPASIELLRGGPVPRLVFANACRSMGPVSRALVSVGVRHLIGSDLDLPDLPGADFARDLHRALFDGLPIGEAVRRARVQALERGDPVWLAYRLRGDPRTRYAEPVTRRRQTELRRAVVLAVRRPAEGGDLEGRIELTRRWRERVEGVVVPAGGTMLPPAGALCRAVFGVPARREDDVHRAAGVALALVADAPDAVVAVDEGRLAVMGDEVLGGPLDRAETRCWTASPGVHLGPRAAEALRGAARFADDDPHRLLATGRRAAPTGPFIGRGAELDRIYRAADEVVSTRRGATITVVGPAGIGKSRLVSAARDRLSQRFAVVRVAGDAEGPYGGVAEMVRRLGRIEPGDGAESARRALRERLSAVAEPDDFLSIDDLLGDRRDETGDRHAETLLAMLGLAEPLAPGAAVDAAVAPAVRALIDATAHPRPVAVIVEDLHHAPRPATAVIEALTADPPFALMVLTARPGCAAADRPAGPGRHRVELAPLSDRAARALVAALRPEAPPDTLDRLMQRAEGNPLFIHELTRADRVDGDALPETVEAVIQARLDRLDADDRALLRAAAVLGRVFWLEGVEQLSGRHGLGPAFDRLAAQRFVTPDAKSDLAGTTQWRFEHGLLHAVVEGSIPRRARAALHGRAALWLTDEVIGDTGPRAARIARHREAAGDHRRAVDDWIAAADHAESTLAPQEARVALGAALRLQGALVEAGHDVPPAERATLEARLGELDRIAGDFDVAAERFARSLAATPPDAAADRAWRLDRVSAIDASQGRMEAAREASAQALDALTAAPIPPFIRATVVHRAAWLDYRDGELDRAEARLETLLGDLPADARSSLAMAWRLLGTIAHQRGDADRADGWLRRALGALRDDAERVRVLHGLALVAVQRADYDEAARRYAESIQIRARRGDRAGLAKTYSNLGTLYGERGDYVRAERYLREAIRIRGRIGHASLAISHANMVELYLRQDRHDDARVELDRVTALLDAGEAPSWARGELWRMIADVRLRHGDLDVASVAADRAVAVSREMGDRPREAGGLEVRARVAAARDRIDDAIEALEAAIEIHEDLDAIGPLADAMDGLAVHLDARDVQQAADLRRQARVLREVDG